MIVNVWSVKRPKLNEKIAYVMDEDKVCSDNGEGFVLPFINDLSCYIVNNGEQEPARCYISGYRCSVNSIEDDFMRTVHDIVRCREGKELPTKDDVVAFHLVQSFPPDIDISPEMAHQCGIELLIALRNHQGIVCTQKHPGLPDEPEELHNKCVHNHILFNAYKCVDCLDHEYPDQVKYHQSRENFRWLTYQNDMIAIKHGLPIICVPDMKRERSWYESKIEKEDKSWKAMLKEDIEEARQKASNFSDFVYEMMDRGYVIRQGADIKYITPIGTSVYARKLGREYTREELQKQWDAKKIDGKIEAVDRYTNHKKRLMAANQQAGPLNVIIPLGTPYEGKCLTECYDLRYLATKDAYDTYFAPYDEFLVLDKAGNLLEQILGIVLIDYLTELREKPTIGKSRNEKEVIYYVDDRFRNSQTRELYYVDYYDGIRRKSLIEVILELGATILRGEKGRWDEKNIPNDKTNSPIYAKIDWKIQNTLDAIVIAREEGISTPGEIEKRVQSAKEEFNKALKSVAETEKKLGELEPIAQALRNYAESKNNAKKILNLPQEDETKEALVEIYQPIIRLYQESEALLRQYGINNQAAWEAFKKQYEKKKKVLSTQQKLLEDQKNQCARLRKLQYQMELVQNAQYVYGPKYVLGNRNSGVQNNWPREKGGELRR